LDNVPPGDYKLSLDAASIPPNYLAPVDSVAVHVSPVSTVVQDIPLRALRSISGTVLLRTVVPSQRGKALKAGSQPAPTPPSQEFKLVPVAGVEIAAGFSTATTDADGKFLLRNLPAGELKVTVTPVKPVPAGMNIPSGAVKLPAEPVQVQGATIVITNSDLLPYLSREFHNGSPTGTGERIAEVNAPRIQTKPVAHDVTTVNPIPAVGAPPVSATTPPAIGVESHGATAQSVAAPPTTTPILAAAEPTKADASAAPPIPQLVPRADVPHTFATAPADGVLTREVCNQLPSLGEIAQCLRQLKLNSSANPK
jgi:hypothetical protein